jgi:hypothetical protein
VHLDKRAGVVERHFFATGRYNQRPGPRRISLPSPRLIPGIDIYNDRPAESTITISSPETQRVSVTLKPNELRRLRTHWQTPGSKVTFDLTNPQSLHFDNLAYQRE